MTPRVAITLDQLYRPQPGGIATYVRGLVAGLAALDDAVAVVGVAPRADPKVELAALALTPVSVGLPVGVLTRLWAHWPLGVPGDCDVVHATTLAGPFAGGRRGAVHAVAVHDLLWRDQADASTPRGVRFHESRLRALRERDDVRVVTTAPNLAERLIAEGFDADRVRPVRLGIDDDVVAGEAPAVARLLATYDVRGPFTLYVGTREPRKNLERLVVAHARARATNAELGPLVVVGPTGWGSLDLGDAVVVGPVPRSLLKGLYRDASVVAYVPLAEGYGLPPVEALGAGARVVASSSTPSVANNADVVTVDPLDVASIQNGLLEAVAHSNDASERRRRALSVSTLTWRHCAFDHLAAWR